MTDALTLTLGEFVAADAINRGTLGAIEDPEARAVAVTGVGWLISRGLAEWSDDGEVTLVPEASDLLSELSTPPLLSVTRDDGVGPLEWIHLYASSQGFVAVQLQPPSEVVVSPLSYDDAVRLVDEIVTAAGNDVLDPVQHDVVAMSAPERAHADGSVQAAWPDAWAGSVLHTVMSPADESAVTWVREQGYAWIIEAAPDGDALIGVPTGGAGIQSAVRSVASAVV